MPPDHAHAPAVNALGRADITQGCGARRFCPSARVTRAQLANFVVRVLQAD